MPPGAHTQADLRRAPLAAVRAVDFRSPERDLWADEAALWDRMTTTWAGLDDAAWHLAGAAPSDGGGPGLRDPRPQSCILLRYHRTAGCPSGQWERTVNPSA